MVRDQATNTLARHRSPPVPRRFGLRLTTAWTGQQIGSGSGSTTVYRPGDQPGLRAGDEARIDVNGGEHGTRLEGAV